jgi:hypothetical protein
MNDAENENVFSFDAVNDDVIAHRETAGPFSEIAIAGSSGVRESGGENESVDYLVDQLRGNTHTAAFFGNVKPNVVKIGFDDRCDAICHYSASANSAIKRARPRSLTSAAICRMDSFVISRPSPRARDARARSKVARNSTRRRSRSSRRGSASTTASSSLRNRPFSTARRANALWSGVSWISICATPFLRTPP